FQPVHSGAIAMRNASFLLTCSLAAWATLPGCATSYIIKSPTAVFEDSQVYQPLRYPGGDWKKKDDLGAIDAWIPTEDNVLLHGWYLAHEDPVAYVLFAHGN